MIHNWFFYLFLTLFILHEVIEWSLILLNQSHVKKHQHQIPNFYQDKISPGEYQKSIAYTLEKSHFGLIVGALSLPVFWGAIFFGFFNSLDDWTKQIFNSSGIIHSVIYCLSLGIILMILSIPTSLYSHFVIEKKYGFNKMTYKTFVLDLVKSLFLGALLGIPILYLVFWLLKVSGTYWWLYAFLAVFGFELLIAAIYPTLLAPLFNKFIPLSEGTLKESILAIAKKINFKMSGIFTIDGSKRSSHSNAYFAGMGKMRRIVLFDTLLKQMNEKETLAVLAHEMGHNKKKHIQKQMILSFIFSFIGFWILSVVINWEPFYQAFNAGSPTPHKALILFALCSGYFTFMLTPLMNFISRKNEYEADKFSVETTGDKESMASSLVKLSKENLSNLTPHPWYSFYHYSHPTTLERIKAITT